MNSIHDQADLKSRLFHQISISVDTPDPYVQFEVLNNPCGIKKTEAKINTVNPVWNETFTFVLDPLQNNRLGTPRLCQLY